MSNIMNKTKLNTLSDSEMQAVLDIAIESKCFHQSNTLNLDDQSIDSDFNWNEETASSMCSALYIARKRELIHEETRIRATKTIMDWLHNSGASSSYLKSTLKFFGFDYDFEARLNIYLNWSHRPFNNTEIEGN